MANCGLSGGPLASHSKTTCAGERGRKKEGSTPTRSRARQWPGPWLNRFVYLSSMFSGELNRNLSPLSTGQERVLGLIVIRSGWATVPADGTQ